MMNKQTWNRKQNHWSSLLTLIAVIGGLALAADDGLIPVANAQEDLVYVPLDSPCRVVNTRNTGSTDLIALTSRDFFSFGSAVTIDAQGGNPAGCDHPRSSEGMQPAAIAANITAVGKQGTGNGNITAYPAGSVAPSASTVNYTTAANIANSTLITLRPSDGSFTLLSKGSDVPAIIDVVGYFYPIQGGISIKAVDANNLVIGEFLSYEENELTVFTPQEYLEVSISMSPEITSGAPLFYLTSDCTGAPYSNSANGTVFLAFQPDTVYAKYYIPKDSVAQNITPTSYATEFSGPCQILSGGTPGWYFPASQNVPAITGVANIMYTLPITFQQQ